MHEHGIILNGKEFFYREAGSGPPVLLLHGFGEDGSIWESQYGRLKGYRWLVPDLPGSGMSATIDDMSMEELASTIKDFLDHLNINSCTMIGHSMGGYVTLAFAEHDPSRLNGFGLFHSTAYGDTVEKIESRRKSIAFIRENGAFEFLKTAIPNLYSSQIREKNPALIKEQVDASHNFSAQALVLYYKAMIQRPARTKALENSKVPVLFVIGRWDTAVPFIDAMQQCYLPQLSYIHILEGSGHMGMREETTLANDILINYLNCIHHQTQ